MGNILTDNILWKGFVKIGKTDGEFNSKVLLSVVYILGLGPTSLIAKIFRKKFLELKTEPDKDTYWIERKKEIEFKRSF